MSVMPCALNKEDLEVELEFHYDDEPQPDLVDLVKGDELEDPWFAEPDALIEAIDDDGSIRQPKFRMSVVVTAAALVATVLCLTVV